VTSRATIATVIATTAITSAIKTYAGSRVCHGDP
jgi:hypothetical protein